MTTFNSSNAGLSYGSIAQRTRFVCFLRFLCRAALVVALVAPVGVQAQTRLTYVADLKPAAEADTSRGRVTLEVDKNAESLRFELRVQGVDRIVGSHFHRVRWQTTPDGMRMYLDPSEGEGPTVGYFLNFNSKGVSGNGVISKGIIRKSDLMGGFAKRPLQDLIKHLNAGHFYATVHSLEERQSGVYCCPVALRGFFRPDGAN